MKVQTHSHPLKLALGALSLAVLSACSTGPKDEELRGSAEKLYADARELMDNGNWGSAIKPLERVESRAGGSLLAQQAQLDLAYAYWKTQEKAQALATLDRFIRLNPSSPGLDYALYLRGLINFQAETGFLSTLGGQNMAERDQQATRDAHQSFKQLVEQFPDSRYAADARLRLDHIVNVLAEYEVHVARHYLRKGAYLASVNRAQLALTTYPQTPAAEDALFVMMQAYDRLGQAMLRDDARRVLERNFPQSELVRNGFRAAEKPWWQLW
ncbi:outer membrane protein assembly factor BamD [Ideonella livida]|uniref:Outer membrane protein assembly factor BamD n=1 Tax=Ideonella livida TaxID=2707176 RepID=A0A7C9PGW4_9BURK|nr:outer membrane protein assembly factor BamD [Ideonella livida]NDY90714.1 outer membrane protein assembly factor BamD [Ideonella livida]